MKRKRFRYTVTNFEDLISEAHVVFVELMNQYRSMSEHCIDCEDKCKTYAQFMDTDFEHAFIRKLSGHFTNLFNSTMCNKRSASIRSLTDKDENLELSQSFIIKLGMAYKNNELPENLRDLARDILDQKFSDFKKGPITKYLMEKGWKREDVRRIFREKIV